MNTFLSISHVFVALLTIAAADQQPALLTEPSDGSAASTPEVRVAFAPAEVLETTVHTEGGRTVTVQRLALDRNDPLMPVVNAEPTPEPTDAVPISTEPTPSTFLPLITATVHPGALSRVSWNHHFPDGTSRDVSGWSNIDFNHLEGINTFHATDGSNPSFILAASNETLAAQNAPAFPNTTPTFIPDNANTPPEALLVVDSLHKLYAIEHEKLATAHAGREAARLAAEAELLANPPEPKDLIIRYRIAETPLPTQGEGAGQ